MSFRNPSSRAVCMLSQTLARPRHYVPRVPQLLRSKPRHLTTGTPSSSSHPPHDPINVHRLEAQQRAYQKRRTYYLSAGFIAGMIAIYITATWVPLPPPTKLDSTNSPEDPLVVLGRERKVIVQKLGEEPEERPDVVETGTSHVPTFPRVLDFVDDEAEIARLQGHGKINDDQLVEYQLLGLGVRTVSFLGIQVYVVGMYVATDDIAALQQKLVRLVTPTGTTLVAGEKEKLRSMLTDHERGPEIWNEILKNEGIRTLVRIVPTRNTDFGHLRDAWVRHMTTRAQHEKQEYGDEQFGLAVGEFKQLFNKGSVPKGKELLLSRDRKGKLAVWYDDGKVGAQRLGDVRDERVSRAVWLNYLAGKSVASEPARKSINDGLMEFVERPVGTVATRIDVHV